MSIQSVKPGLEQTNIKRPYLITRLKIVLIIKRDETFTKKQKSEKLLKHIFTINEVNLKFGFFLTK